MVVVASGTASVVVVTAANVVVTEPELVVGSAPAESSLLEQLATTSINATATPNRQIQAYIRTPSYDIGDASTLNHRTSNSAAPFVGSTGRPDTDRVS